MLNRVSSDNASLHIIKASAGSGKTHRLTGEYLNLLFSKPNNHKHILAVTFTNKATDEMKSRIVDELFRLTSGSKSDFLSGLIEKFGLDEKDIRTISKTILETILHDYSSFSISTIDRFFQQTMRAFTREMGLAGGYNVEVDHSALLMETVDLMLSELDDPNNKALTEWILRFMQNSIEEGKSWRVEREVLQLGGELFNETYKSLTDEEQATIQDKAHLENYKQMLMRIVKSYESELKEVGERAVAIMGNSNLLAEDFKGGSRSQFFKFNVIAKGSVPEITKTFLSFPDNIESWYTKKTAPDIIAKIENAYNAGLNDCVKQVIDLYDNNINYNSSKVILQNYYALGILNDIKKRLQKLQQENNVLFISDTTELLNDIIAGSDSPFIYEKTGTRITNYMIDEFQDTSRMQWDNFKPLIEESLASGNFNLIVGDVKQSIYRFRNSDWRLLEEQVDIDFPKEYLEKHLLDTNWRSDAKIVEFNNTFFKSAAAILQNDYNAVACDDENSQIADAYGDLHQHLPEIRNGSTGHVKVTFLDKNNEWKDEALRRLPLEIESLQDQGFALKEIAVVVRSNKEAVEVAEALLEYSDKNPQSHYRYDIISNEALVIGSAQSVTTIISIMRYLRSPDDERLRMMAIYEFYRFKRKGTPNEALLAYREEWNRDFPDDIKHLLNELGSLPFYDMIERFITVSVDSLEEKENAYIQAFLDIALKFSVDKSADINAFIDWWDDKGKDKTLFSPEDQDAIRLITIHKSKGLGFGAVIMPFVNWRFEIGTNNNIIWCKPTVAPFNELNVIPLKYTKKLADTIFKDDYLNEKKLTLIDNLNLLYVAFTRAKHRLIIFAPEPGKGDSIGDASILLERGISNSPTLSGENLKEIDGLSVLELGSPFEHNKKTEIQVSGTYKSTKWHSQPFDNRLQLKLNSIGFFSDDGSRDYGKLMHDIVSNIEKLEDIPVAVSRKISEGEIKEDNRDIIINEIESYLTKPEVIEWYSGIYNVLNEAVVLHPSSGISRPDRVMIGKDKVIVVDYKFGESVETKYKYQVKRYMKSISEMGYTHVEGFIYYVKSGKVEAV
ncbi:MAG TPA: UvrD-helicase domain-containing protein [Bacteroidales bacterium]|nr:UvrD-helicase domain-containing protein [Bacteroidales bacterium]